MDTLDLFMDSVADQFIDELSRMPLFTEKRVSQALLLKGVSADSVNKLTDGKTAGPLVKVLGGLVARGLWYVLIRPFQVLAKLIHSSEFRAEIKADVRRAFRKEIRDTRHMVDVAGRWSRGEEIHPREFQAAKQQLLRIVTKLVLVYFASAPAVTGLFSSGLWKVLQRLAAPADEILVLLLERPLTALMGRLLRAPV
jgi:hypothetical protein